MPIQVYFTKVIIHLSPRDIVGLILSVEATFIASQCLHMTSTWNTSQFPVYSPLFLQTKPNAWQMSLPEQCHSQCKARAFCLMCTLFFFCMQAEASGLKTSHVWCASCAALSGGTLGKWCDVSVNRLVSGKRVHLKRMFRFCQNVPWHVVWETRKGFFIFTPQKCHTCDRDIF